MRTNLYIIIASASILSFCIIGCTDSSTKEMTQKSVQPVEEETPSPVSKIQVQGIILSDNPTALINGEIMHEGDLGDNFTIQKIGADYVKVDINGSIVEIKPTDSSDNINQESDLPEYDQTEENRISLDSIKENREDAQPKFSEAGINRHYRMSRELYLKASVYAKNQKTMGEAVYYCQKSLQEAKYALNLANDGAPAETIEFLAKLKMALENDLAVLKRQLESPAQSF